MSYTGSIHFILNNVSLQLKERKRLKSFIVQLFHDKRMELESLTYIFCTDEFVLSLNQEHLKHNFYTDILTFELSPSNRPIIGEIYISVDRVKENASSFGESFNKELHRVIFHGALHLCGYGDKSPKEARNMRKMEEICLDGYFSKE